MKLGIIGLPSSGKTTVFNALTKGDTPIGQNMGGRFEVVTAVVDVHDPRIDLLTKMFNPKKTVYARITYTDIGGLKKSGEKGGMSAELLNHLAGLDGFVHVVRAFQSDLVPHADGSVDPLRDLAALDTEFLLNDLAIVERRMQKLQEGIQRGAFKDKTAAQAELALFEQFNDLLTQEKPLRLITLDDEQFKLIRGYGLLTLKPTVVIFNIGDDQAEVAYQSPFAHTVVTNLRGKLEMELAQLNRAGDTETLAMFMEEYGVKELSLDRIIHLTYELMGLHAFFTVGEDEVRAWTIERGSTAVAAAGAIHSDLAKGFIRAETVSYDDLISLGSLAQARTTGKLRQEGKTYIVQDGDVINIKFNI